MSIAGMLLGAAVLCQPNLAYAAPHGGGGFHGGAGFSGGAGFHAGGFGGFHGDGIQPEGLHGGGLHGSVAGVHNSFGYGHGGHWYHGWRDGRYGGRWGNEFGWSDYPYTYGWDGSPAYGYYDHSQPYATQTWYYCSDPAGYYPYVSQCNNAWQSVPGG